MTNPAYKEQADRLLESAQAIRAAAEAHGFKSTMFVAVMLSELMKVSQITASFTALPKSERDDFLAEVWDSAIGEEPAALVHQVGFLSPAATEQVSDALKTAVLAYFNRALPPA